MDPENKIENADFETAILHSGYGRFQWILLIVSGIVYATCAISATTLSFVLPAAECDFMLSSTDKGRLSAMPLIGMVFGSYVWGSLADTRGRKWIMVISLLMDALAAFVSSVAQDYEWFLICRFFNGFGIIGATSLIFSYLGEFLSVINRDEILCKLEVFWNIGIILLPAIAWLILPQPWNFTTSTNFTYNSWRIFVAMCGMPSLLSAVLLCFLPESPKYLIAKGQQDKARKVLQGIYAVNTGNCFTEYPVQQLQGENICLLNGAFKKVHMPWHRRLLTQAKDLMFLNKEVFTPPNTRYIFLTCFADFGLMASYYTLLLWFPDLFDRFDMYNSLHPNQSAGVCDVTSVSSPLQIEDWNIMMQYCPKPIDDKVFLYTIIIGVSCLPSSISLSYLIRKVGKKRLIVFSLTTAGLSVIGLNLVQGTIDTLILSCIFEALTSTCEAVIFCVVVDLFPTSLRAIALALTVTSGRFGAILGNILFGWLVDLNCFVPIYAFGILLITSGLLSIYLPKDGQIVPH